MRNRVLWVIVVPAALWLLVGCVATNSVVGKHPDWRTLTSHPEDFGLRAERVSLSSLDGIPLRG